MPYDSRCLTSNITYIITDKIRHQTCDNSYMTADICCHVWHHITVRDWPLENLWGGRANYKKKIRARENLIIKKNSCTPINPKKYSCKGLKKIHTRNLITKKNSCGSKIPLPPHNFSNGPSLIRRLIVDIRPLITVIWQQTSDIRRLLSYNCYQTSDII